MCHCWRVHSHVMFTKPSFRQFTYLCTSSVCVHLTSVWSLMCAYLHMTKLKETLWFTFDKHCFDHFWGVLYRNFYEVKYGSGSINIQIHEKNIVFKFKFPWVQKTEWSPILMFSGKFWYFAVSYCWLKSLLGVKQLGEILHFFYFIFYIFTQYLFLYMSMKHGVWNHYMNMHCWDMKPLDLAFQLGIH